MERRKAIIYSISIIVAAYGFHFHFLSGESVTKSNSSASTPVISKAKVTSTMEDELSAQIISSSMEVKPAEQTGKSRNPFKNNKADQRNNPISGTPIQYARPSVSAISSDGRSTFVIANNKIIKIGETVGVWRLIKVESEKALFDGPDGTIWVSLGG